MGSSLALCRGRKDSFRYSIILTFRASSGVLLRSFKNCFLFDSLAAKFRPGPMKYATIASIVLYSFFTHYSFFPMDAHAVVFGVFDGEESSLNRVLANNVFVLSHCLFLKS